MEKITKKSMEVPNSETLSAFREAEDIKRNPGNYKAYDDVDRMFEDVIN